MTGGEHAIGVYRRVQTGGRMVAVWPVRVVGRFDASRGRKAVSAGATTIAPGATTPSTVTRSDCHARSCGSRTVSATKLPHAKQSLYPQRRQALVRAAVGLVGRCLAVEGVLVATALVCALVGLPAIVTAFCVALVGFLANLWLALRTLGPVARRLLNGGRA